MTTKDLDHKLDTLIAEFHCSLLDSIPDDGNLPVVMSDFNEFADYTVRALTEFRKAIIEYLQSN